MKNLTHGPRPICDKERSVKHLAGFFHLILILMCSILLVVV